MSEPVMIWNFSLWNQSVWGPAQPNSNPHNPMAQQDLTNITLDQAWIDELNTKAQALITHMLTKAVSLTVEQRKRHQGIGPENLSLVANGTALIRDNADWSTPALNRPKLLKDIAVRDLLLLGKTAIMQVNELFFDTLQAVSADIVRRVRKARPFIESGAALTGMNNDQVQEYLEWFNRFTGEEEEEQQPTPPTPPTP
jgi:hypothetical protein